MSAEAEPRRNGFLAAFPGWGYVGGPEVEIWFRLLPYMERREDDGKSGGNTSPVE